MKTLGRATVRLDGEELLIDNGATFDPGGIQRNLVKGTTIHGYAEEAMEARVECSMTMTADTDLKKIGATENATVVFEADTGQIFVLSNAWLEPTPKVTAQEGGRIPLVFVAKQYEQI